MPTPILDKSLSSMQSPLPPSCGDLTIYSGCTMCNDCKHMGITGRLAARGKLDIIAVKDNFCRVNDISHEEFAMIWASAFKQFRERSKHEWTQDFGEYSSLIVS